jgi:hypothetical protein
MYGRFTGLVLSLFLPAFYRHVARSWGGIGLLYLILLFTLTWIPALVKIHLGAQKFAQEDFPKVAEKLPDITIKNGKISSPVEQPLEIKDDMGNVVFVLDTTGKINNLEQTKAMILITETKLFQRDQLNNIQIHDLSTFPDFDFTKERVQGWVDTATTWLAVSLYPLFMIGSLIRALVIMLLASIAGVVANSAFNARVTYGGLLRFAAVGMTLSVYLDTGLGLAEIQVPFWFLIALALTVVYVVFGTAVSIPPPMEIAGLGVDREDHEDHDDHEDDWKSPRRKADPDDGGFKSGDP